MDSLTDSETEELDPQMEDIKKSLLADLSEPEELMPPPPLASTHDDTMKILLRVRPLKETEKQAGESQGCVDVKDSTTIELFPPKSSKAHNHSNRKISFKFNQVYDEHTSQKIFFEDGVLEMVQQFLDGENCLLFAYGVTNSGKTYTMQGSSAEKGVIPRSFDLIFNSIGDRLWHQADMKPRCYSDIKKLVPSELAAADKFKTLVMNAANTALGDNSDLYSSCDSLASQSSVDDTFLEALDEDTISLKTTNQESLKFSVWVSFAEVYNEQIYDLLEPPSKHKRKTLTLREDKAGNPYIKDLRHIHVTSAEEALKVMNFGQRSLQHACTKLNESSSRSHCIFTLKIVRVADVANPKRAQTSQLSFCDLAGSERYKRTGSTGERLKEAANINTSLLTLSRCIKFLRKNQPGKLVPFRDSKLTRLFQAFFSGRGRASMLVNISPAASSFDENLQALKFSSIAKYVPITTSKADIPQAPSVSRTAVSLSLEQGDTSHRVSIPWAPAGIVEKDEDAEEMTEETEEPYEDMIERYETAIDKLKGALITANELLKEERRSKKKLREEITKEMMEQITEIENDHLDQMDAQRQRIEDAAEIKLNIIQAAVNKSVRRRQREGSEELHKVTEELKLKLEEKEEEFVQKTSELEEKLKEEFVQKTSELEEKLKEEFVQKTSELEGKLKELEEKEKNRQDEGDDLASNEIFIQLTQRLKNTETALKEKEEEADSLRAQLDSLRDVTNEQSSEINRYKKQQSDTLPVQGETEMERLVLEVEELRAAVMNREDDVKDVQTKLSTAQSQHNSIVKELELEVLAVSRGLQASDRLKEDAEQKLADSMQRLRETEGKLEAEQVHSGSLKCEVEQMQAAIALRTNEYSELVTELDQLKNTMSQLTTDREGSDELQAKYSTLSGNMKKLQDQLRRRSVELQGDMSTVQTDLLACKQELARVKKEREKLQSQLDRTQRDSLQINRTNLSMSDEMEEIKKQLSSLIDKHQESQAIVEEQAVMLTSQQSELLDVTNRKDTLDEELHALRDLLQKTEQRSSAMESTVYQLRKELSDKTKQTSEKDEKEWQKLEDKLQAAIEDNETLQGELAEKQEMLDANAGRQRALQSQLEEQTQKVDALSITHAELSSKSNAAQELEKEVEMRRGEVKGLFDEVATLQKELDETNKKCNQFSTLESRVLDMSRKCDEQSELYDRAVEKITQLTSDNRRLQDQMAAASKRAALKVEELTEDVSSKEKKAESLRVILEARQSEWERKDSTHESVRQKAGELEKENVELHKELSAHSIKLVDMDEKLQEQSTTSIALEKRLRAQLAELKDEISSLTGDLKATGEKLSAAEAMRGEPTENDQLIETLKAAIDEQEKTMKMQDEVVEVKEKQICELNKEVCEWRLKCQELCDVDLEKISLQSKLTSANNEKTFLQDMQSQMMSQVSTLNEQTSKLNTEISRLKEENKKLEDRLGSVADGEVKEEETELEALKKEMEEWQANKQVLVEELRQVLADKDETINRLQSSDESPQVKELSDKLAKKEKVILLLESKIHRQESTIQDLVCGSTRTTRSRTGSEASASADDTSKIQSLQAELDEEKRKHEKTQETLDRVHFAKDEQANDLKQANEKLQKEIDQLNKRVSSRASERFKEPNFSNDDELSQSTLQLDVTPMSSSKKRQRVSRKSSRKTTSSRKESLQKENVPSTGRTSTLKRRLQGLVENSTSPLASPAKKLLQVRVTPLKGSVAVDSPDTPADQLPRATRTRRNLYTVGEQVLSSPPVQEPGSGRRTTRATNIHTNVLRSMRSSQLK